MDHNPNYNFDQLPDPRTIANVAKKICDVTVKSGGAQNEYRYKALASVYNNIAFVVTLRSLYGFLNSVSMLGFDNDEKYGRDPDELYNADGSSEFPGDDSPTVQLPR